MTDLLAIYAIVLSVIAVALAIGLTHNEHRYSHSVNADHAKALDRIETELLIIKRELGIEVHWDRQDGTKVPYSVPVASAHRHISPTRMDA